MQQTDIPSSETMDAVMASHHEIDQMHAWVRTVFLGSASGTRLPLIVKRQDHSVLQFGRSCIDTQLKIGNKRYRHGLGTHAISEIAVKLPAGVRCFEAEVGIDNNFDTGGSRGSVTFSVQVDGRELFASGVRRGNNAPLPIAIDLPVGSRELTLKVGDAGDGPNCDQADWADARLLSGSGEPVYLDANQFDMLLAEGGPPFSFTYAGKSSSSLMTSWARSVSAVESVDRTVYHVAWNHVQTGLVVGAAVTVFKAYPAVDWVLTFENHGKADTPILENIQALDVSLRSGYVKRPLIINEIHGDDCSEHSFAPLCTQLEGGKSYRMAPSGGRPSSTTAFPWWNVQYADQGCITAIGWTGQWASTIERAGNGPGRMLAGMEKTHCVLHPGEKVRSPRVLLMPWSGDKLSAHVRFRRLILFHYAPRLQGKPAWLPLNLQTYDRYNGRTGWATEHGQKEYIEAAHKIGFDSAWLDAAWFPGEFPNGVGNWFAKPQEFPNGLRPVTDLAHSLNLKYILWFEPERVAEGTQIALEHPEFVSGGKQGGLFKLDDPAARMWLTNLLSNRIHEWNLDVYRNDFNIDPLGYWRESDMPDRQGITEIRYVQGLYEMWDSLLRQHPGLLIDNCASGGRRLDLEMIMRSVPLWRSDTGCSPGHPEWNQMQSMQLAQYLPQFNISCWETDFNEMRSAATMGMNCEFPYLDSGFSLELARKVIAEAQRNRWHWYGDFYPLTNASTAPDQFVAYQLHRPDKDSGVVYGFRRKECRIVGIIVGLRGISAHNRYLVEVLDNAGKTIDRETKSGKQLRHELVIKVPAAGESVVIMYHPTKQQ